MTIIHPSARVGATPIVPQKLDPPSSSPDRTFAETLKNSIEDVNRLQLETDTAIQNLVSGKAEDVHEVMVAMEKASLSLELLVQVRNKVIAAYDEIKRMQI